MIQVDQNILIYAFRYALGRMSYSVSDVVEAIKENWDKINENAKNIITKEIQEAIKNNEAGDPDIDVPLWRSILELE